MSVYAQAPYIQWQKCLGGTDYDEALSIRQTSDSGYIIAGVSSSNNGDVSGHHGSAFNYDCWVIKTSPTGSIQWQVSLGGTKTEYVYSIQQTTDGGYILATYTQSTDGDVSGNHGTTPYNDVWIVKLSAAGGTNGENVSVALKMMHVQQSNKLMTADILLPGLVVQIMAM